MISADLIGALAIAVPAIIVAYLAFFWRRRPIFWFVLGYLQSTGALHNVGAAIVGEAEMVEQGR